MNSAFRLAIVVTAHLYRGYFATLRIRGVRADGSIETKRRYRFGHEVLAICERDLLALGGLLTVNESTVLVAHGRDGDWASCAVAALGGHVVRGAAGRGGARALIEMIHELTCTNRPLAIVVDGPLGPPGRAKGGAALCAIKSGRPLRAIGVAAQRCIVFRKAWSHIYLPLPFTRVAVALDDVPLMQSERAPDVGATTEELTRRLAQTRQRALEFVGHSNPRHHEHLPSATL